MTGRKSIHLGDIQLVWVYSQFLEDLKNPVVNLLNENKVPEPDNLSTFQELLTKSPRIS